ncbi:MAG: RagB/SusD family nutrient uptake outer membrane protein [Bacteroidales bacterium]|nr:RagB/SusD family nutrient uptake outer membrane protein [Bacteroidales bacterium]
MKQYISKISIITLIIIVFSGCFKDLDVAPIDPNVVSSDNVYKTVDDYLSGLAKLYTSIGLSGLVGPNGDPDFQGFDEGFSTYTRSFWNVQEVSTDEAVSRGDAAAGLPDFHAQSWTPTNSYLSILHSRIMYLVAVCNEYIRLASNSGFPEVDVFVAEARFIRALGYWHAMDLFGTSPFVTEADLPGAFFPPRATREELFTYIESELKAIEPILGEPRFLYGRADKAAAWMVLAKIYLNAEVYIGEDRYDDAITELVKLIGSSYELSTEQRANFLADNNTSPEIIFPIIQDGLTTQTWGGTTYLMAGAMGGGSITAQETIGITAQWGILRVTSALVNLFEPTDVRATFWSEGQTLEITDVELFSNGYMSTKFKNRKLDGSVSNSNLATHPDTDFPMFRLGDAYLMYAEAVLRGGNGSMTTALGYVNDLRTRAGASTLTTEQLDLDFILDERARELFWEGHRRTDLIRFGQFTNGTKVWPWKGGVAEGRATESYRDLYPVPATQLTANPNLIQNDGY